MADTIRIRTTPNGEDKYIKINVEQKWFYWGFVVKIIPRRYRKFCSDYGVIVGRVSVNNGLVPNG
jgi:hypothetical protein